MYDVLSSVEHKRRYLEKNSEFIDFHCKEKNTTKTPRFLKNTTKTPRFLMPHDMKVKYHMGVGCSFKINNQKLKSGSNSVIVLLQMKR